ncbi:MAG: 4Fe-4S binding protein [Elusimicrobia bacterium]|nr:4Fe-4S binding protein [Elusimicrobiota bacterium]
MENRGKRQPDVSGCNKNATCPNSLGRAEGLRRRMESLLEEEGLAAWVGRMLPEPALARHAFRAATAECPNACSRPQIKDFGVIQRSLPGKGGGACDNCGLCVKACCECGITLDARGPAVDLELCVRCGACAKVCPTGALRAEKKGFSVYIGGRLGRHPRLGVEVLELTDEEGVLLALRAVVKGYIREGRRGERFGDLADRLGLGRLKAEIEAALSGQPA